MPAAAAAAVHVIGVPATTGNETFAVSDDTDNRRGS